MKNAGLSLSRYSKNWRNLIPIRVAKLAHISICNDDNFFFFCYHYAIIRGKVCLIGTAREEGGSRVLGGTVPRTIPLRMT